MPAFPVTDLNKVRRLSKRGRYDTESIYEIVDEALICHVEFVCDNQPVVIPTIHARLDDTLFLHGAAGNRMLTNARRGNPLCVTVTIVDGIVLARSVFHSSMNYRSAVLFGKGVALETDEEKLRALEAITEHVCRGRWNDARKPTKKELDATAVIALPIASASAKVRTGPPMDDEEDYALPIWAGIVPLEQHSPFPPRADTRLGSGITVPTYAQEYKRTRPNTFNPATDPNAP
jgi:nitroimidazol reductase NimA-like FMN-containing flavoprotein (pyridoxamine 5'-phosphate oxidase superfamily)